MAVSAKTQINADVVLCKLEPETGGTGSAIEWDIAGDSNPLLGHGAHTVNKFTSQNIKSNGITKDGTYESATLTVTFLSSEYEQIETWWKSGTLLKYTVTGLSASAKVYNKCLARVSSTPTVTAGKLDYVTFQIEISSIDTVSGS